MSEAHAIAEGGYEDILYEVKERVGLITLNRPDKLNAWTAEMQNSVKQAIADAVADDTVRAIVITGAGRGFCAGADMGGLQKIEPGTGEDRELARDRGAKADWPTELGPDVAEHYKGRFGYMFRAPKPIIAAINGPCAGIGMVMTLYCDLRFMARGAIFTTAFSKRGLIAEHGMSWLLPNLLGTSASLDLLLSARKVTAEEAANMGLVNQVVDDDALLDTAMAYANDLAENVSPRSMAVMKAQVYKAMFEDFNAALKRGDEEMYKSFSSEDFKEGVAHFVEKRAPNFTGR